MWERKPLPTGGLPPTSERHLPRRQNIGRCRLTTRAITSALDPSYGAPAAGLGSVAAWCATTTQTSGSILEGPNR